MRVLMMVQRVDEDDALLGFTVMWIRALAARVEQLHVLTLEAGKADLPDNVIVHSMGKEHGHGNVRELMEFYRTLRRVIRDVDVIFSHMIPRYTWLAAPYALVFHKPQLLWYTHRQHSLELRLALACARWVATAVPSSFPLESHKVHALGHGIDTARFSPQAGQRDNPPLVLAVGRIAPIKHHHILLEAAALLRDQYELPPVRFAVAGTTGVESDEEYLESLKKRRCKLGMIEEDFAFLGPKQTDEMIELYRRASVVTNLSPIGLFDKAALEAMATETPVIVSNPAFDTLLGKHADLLRVEHPDDAEGVAERLAGLLSLPVAERAKIGQELRTRTVVEHGLDRLMTRITNLMQEGS